MINNSNKYNNQSSNRKRDVVTYTDYNIFNGNVRVVGEGAPRVMSRDDAISLAKSRGMNLVQIAYNKNDNPRSVCKIMDYSKFKYEQKKKEKQAKRMQKEMASELKEIKFSIRIDDGDMHTKINKVKELLADGDRVKLTIRLLRREMDRLELAKNTMRGILTELETVAEMDQTPSMLGNMMSCVIKRRR